MRPRKKDRHLPKYVYKRRGAYYLVENGVWVPLGRDLSAALAEYGRRHTSEVQGALDREIDALITVLTANKPKSTKVAYGAAGKWIKRLFRNFTTASQIKPKDVAKAKLLLADKPIMANRVLAVLRSMFDYWLEHEQVDHNPARGIRGYGRSKRTRLISAQEYNAIYAKAAPQIQVIMDLWRLTGQRVMDTVRIAHADLRDEGIYFRQQKTGTELIVRWNPELRETVDRAKAMRGNVLSRTILHNLHGRPLGYAAVNRMWLAASRAANVENVQARDLRAMALTAIKGQRGKKAAQNLGGHKREATTEIYLRDREILIVDGPSFGQILDVQNKLAENQ